MTRLARRKLLLTRSADDAGDWAERLTAEGAIPIVFPCIRSERIDDPALAADLRAAIAAADWLVVTSRRGVDAVADLVGSELPPALRLAAVGAATAARLIERFGPSGVDVVGSGTARDLGRALAEDPSIRAGAQCLLALASNAGPTLEALLTAAGAGVRRIDIYRTIPAAPLATKRALSGFDCDTVIFASPTAVAGFANQVDVDRPGVFVTIGPSTSAAIRARAWTVGAEAKEPTLAGIIESLLETSHA